jgi:hypothetical protein
VNPNTKIKVDRLQLIAAVEERVAKLQEEFNTKSKTYKKPDRKAVQLAVLRQHIDAVRSGASVIDSSGQINYSHRICPEYGNDKPSDYELNNAKRALAQLRMGTDAAITLTAEDFGRYIG